MIGIIPARYGSTRFPGKPLALLGGKPVLQWVYQHASEVFDRVVVATDDERIQAAVKRFGGEVLMSRSRHTSGTSRVAEVAKTIGAEGVVVNIQGDEPMISPTDLRALTHVFDRDDVDIATLIQRVPPETPYAEIEDPNTPKVVLDENGDALYFSRSVIPAVRGVPHQEWPARAQYYTHVGVYAYRCEILDVLAALPPSPLAIAENLEQLTWLSHGYRISTVVATSPSIGIDTPADLARTELLITNYKSRITKIHT